MILFSGRVVGVGEGSNGGGVLRETCISVPREITGDLAGGSGAGSLGKFAGGVESCKMRVST